jgi:hypothetical protein
MSSWLFASTDDGRSWKSLGEFPQPNVLDAAFIADTLFLGGAGGLWKASLPSFVTAVRGEPAIPLAFRLEQNFPNPFNGFSNIGFRIAASGVVKLAVYDVLGREIAVLVEESKEPGSYEVKFDGSGLSSGVYFYRLEAGRYAAVRKLMLVR